MARRNSKQAEFVWTPEIVKAMTKTASGKALTAERKLVKDLIASGVENPATPFQDALKALTEPERAARPRREETKSHGQPRVAQADRIKTAFDYSVRLDTQHPGKIASQMRADGVPVGYWLNPVLNALFGSALKVKAGYELSAEDVKACKALTAQPKAPAKPRRNAKQQEQAAA